MYNPPDVFSFAPLAAIVVIGAIAIWLIGKKSMACGVTLGLVVLAMAVAVAALIFQPHLLDYLV